MERKEKRRENVNRATDVGDDWKAIVDEWEVAVKTGDVSALAERHGATEVTGRRAWIICLDSDGDRFAVLDQSRIRLEDFEGRTLETA